MLCTVVAGKTTGGLVRPPVVCLLLGLLGEFAFGLLPELPAIPRRTARLFPLVVGEFPDFVLRDLPLGALRSGRSSIVVIGTRHVLLSFPGVHRLAQETEHTPHAYTFLCLPIWRYYKLLNGKQQTMQYPILAQQKEGVVHIHAMLPAGDGNAERLHEQHKFHPQVGGGFAEAHIQRRFDPNSVVLIIAPGREGYFLDYR